MIRPLRQRHRRIVIVLGVFIPVAFAVGMVVRKPVPGPISLPAGLASPAEPSATVEWDRADLFARSPVRVRLLRSQARSSGLFVEFSAGKEFIKPDLIVYWAAGDTAIADTLPGNAILLGSFTSAPLRLPEAAANSNGRLVLYSLADNEIVDVSKQVRLNDPAK